MSRININSIDLELEEPIQTFERIKPKTKQVDDKLKLSYKDKSNRKGNRFDRTNMDISI